MLRNYLKIAWRNLWRNKVFSTINIVGLATGMAVTMAIIQYASFELSYESTHKHADRVMRLSMQYYNNDVVVYEDAETYRSLGPLLQDRLPEVIDFTRAHHAGAQDFEIDNRHFKEDNVYWTDNSFFEIFTYPFLEGNRKTALKQPFEVVLTKQSAIKYFGDSSALGKTLKSSLGDTVVNLKVAGVIPDSPPNTHLKFDILVSYQTGISHWNWKIDDWNGNNDYTYLLLDDATSFESFQRKLSVLNREILDEKFHGDEIVAAEKIADIHLFSKKGYEPEPPGDAITVYFLLGIAAFVMLIAWVNYINLSTAKSLERAKEVGIRKVVGSSRYQLRQQFLLESVLSNVFSGLIAISILQLFLPVYQHITGLPAQVTLLDDPLFWVNAGTLILVSIFLSGIYPAFVLSSFRPVHMLSGKFTQSIHGRRLRKILVVLQFSLTLLLLTGALAINQQLNFMKQKDLGMNLDHVVVIDAPTMQSELSNVGAFRNELLKIPDIKAFALSDAVPGLPEHHLSTTNGVRLQGSQKENGFNFHIYAIDEKYLDLMDINLVAGTKFDKPRKEEFNVIVNEEALRRWEIADPKLAIGRKIDDLWGRDRTIIGVIENFHQRSVKSPHLAMILFPINFDHYLNWNFANVKVSTNDLREQIEVIRLTYEEAFPNSVFNYFFLDELFNTQYQSEERFYSVFRIMTSLAILIAALGLYSLASFTVSQKTKEIGIRKVLGASVAQVFGLLSNDFIKLIAIAVVIAIPVAYLSVNQWLDSFPYRIDVYWWLLVLPIVLIAIIAAISISIESLKAAHQNPVEALRYE